MVLFCWVDMMNGSDKLKNNVEKEKKKNPPNSGLKCNLN